MSDWVEQRVEEAICAFLKTRLEMRPYRRMVVGEGRPDDVDCLSVSIGANSCESDQNGRYDVWNCAVSVEGAVADHGRCVENFLEVVDILHEADIDGDELVIIDVRFKDARFVNRSDAAIADRIEISFNIFTILDGTPNSQTVPDTVSA